MDLEFEVLKKLELYIQVGRSALSRVSTALRVLESENMNVQNVVR
jgi:hypothetical protein